MAHLAVWAVWVLVAWLGLVGRPATCMQHGLVGFLLWFDLGPQACLRLQQVAMQPAGCMQDVQSMPRTHWQVMRAMLATYRQSGPYRIRLRPGQAGCAQQEVVGGCVTWA